jgi:hypothetical protein
MKFECRAVATVINDVHMLGIHYAHIIQYKEKWTIRAGTKKDFRTYLDFC